MAVWTSVYQHLMARAPELSNGQPIAKAEFLVMLIILIIVMIAQEILRPKPEFEDARPKGDGDFNFVTATEGRPVPLVWGRVPVNGPNCIWYGDITALPIHDEIRTGWFKKEKFIKGYEYTLGVQFALARGPGVELVRVWLGRENKWLVYDGTVSGILTSDGDRFDINEPTLHFPREGGVQATCDFYTGTTTQPVNDYLKTAERQLQSPMTEVPRYSGTAYVMARQLTSVAPTSGDLGAYVGNDANVDPWSFEVQRFPPVFSGQSAGDQVVPASTGIDCNPMNVIYEILTDTEWGLGFLGGEVGVGVGSSFLSAATVLETEVNGFSFILDRQIPTVDLLAEVENQIDGIVFLSQATGKWEVKLARNDYVIATLPHFDETNSAFSDYSRSTWEDTTNQLTVKFNKRVDDYKESYAVAQDSANIIMQGGGSIATGKVVSGSVSFPGCKLEALAANLVWRSLRTRAYPISRAKFVVSREFWELGPGDVFKWSNEELDINEQPMRITSIDFGKLTDNKITITAIQDIFEFFAPSFGEPGATDHIEPAQTVVAIPVDEQLAFEAPRAMVVRDLDFAGDENISKLYIGARRQGPETIVNITERHAAGTPAGVFSSAGIMSGFIRIGSLKAALAAGTAIPTTAIVIESDPDTQALLESEFNDASTLLDLGTILHQMVMINDEIIIVQAASNSSLDVSLDTCYRGALDTAQGDHSAGDDVYLFSFGGVLTDTSFPTTDNIHVRLLPQSMTSTLASGDANQIALTMAQRTIRPYPPSAIQYNASASNYGTPNLEGDGSGLNGFGIDIDWLRQQFNNTDEVAAKAVDVTPTLTTGYELEIRHTPYGAGDIAWASTEVDTDGWIVGNQLSDGVGGADVIALRTKILDGSPNTAHQELQFRIRSRHTNGGVTDIESRYDLTHTVTPTSTLSGQVAMGKHTWSNALPTAYVAAATGTFTINIGSAFSTGNVQYNINAGGWVTSFAAGLTTGTIPGVSATDSIQIRHDADDGAQLNFVEIQNPSAVAVAYGIFQS